MLINAFVSNPTVIRRSNNDALNYLIFSLPLVLGGDIIYFQFVLSCRCRSQFLLIKCSRSNSRNEDRYILCNYKATVA